ncbi:MAG TPA: nucleotide-binding protein [Pyrinomonadaceae bacterium]|jgi:predicted nucleotide-binding protein|nr:nucleotide-binding protein [Pyrinomonadaceae bacterium]
MAKRQNSVQLPPPRLIVPRDDAAAKIQAQIDKGLTLREIVIRSEDDLRKARAGKSKWSQYNVELLTRLFDNPSIANEYDPPRAFIIGDDYLEERIESFRRDVDYYVTKLESVLDRLELIPEPLIDVKAATLEESKESDSLSRNIFIVHGHDEAAREATARFIEKLGLRPIILHERPNSGKTLIEKFEHNADVGFTIVLLTPDDIGYRKDHPEEAGPRARQNVIFELGYFLGRLNRAKVCALYKGDIEILSDYQGVLYIPMDSGGAWRFLLAKEIRAAGLDVDLNKIL